MFPFAAPLAIIAALWLLIPSDPSSPVSVHGTTQNGAASFGFAVNVPTLGEPLKFATNATVPKEWATGLVGAMIPGFGVATAIASIGWAAISRTLLANQNNQQAAINAYRTTQGAIDKACRRNC